MEQMEVFYSSVLFSNDLGVACKIKFQRLFHLPSAVWYFEWKNSLNKTGIRNIFKC